MLDARANARYNFFLILYTLLESLFRKRESQFKLDVKRNIHYKTFKVSTAPHIIISISFKIYNYSWMVQNIITEINKKTKLDV